VAPLKIASIERFYLKLEASLDGDATDPVRGKFPLAST